MPDPADLQRAREAVAKAVDLRVRVFQDELAIVWRKLDRRLATLVSEAASGSPTAIIRAARAGRLKRAIEEAFVRAGWAALVDMSTSTALSPVITDVERLRLVAELDAFAPSDRPKLDALQALAATDVLNEGDHVAGLLWRATVHGIFGSRPVPQILDDLADVLDQTAPQIRTLYDTSISVVARQAELLNVPTEDDSPFVYTGPDDDKVRPFCRQHLGKVYTKATIDQMDNGQILNVFLTAGGYNCRHAFTAVSKFSTLAPLADTGERVPEFSRHVSIGGSKAA